MSTQGEIKKAIVDAEATNMGLGFVYAEISFIAIGLGSWLSSWWVFGAVFIGLFIILNIKPLAIVFSWILTLACGVIGYLIGSYFFHSMGAAVVIAILALLFSGGAHVRTLEYLKH